MVYEFIHLRVHTNYSVGESSLNINNIVDLCRLNNMPALGMCDSGNLFAAREFSYKLSTGGIKPLIGLEVNVIQSIDNKTIKGNICLFAKNENGYKNLLKIHEQIYLYKNKHNLESPQIQLGDIVDFLDDNVILSGGVDGFLANGISHLSEDAVDELLGPFINRDFYIELNRIFSEKDFELEPKLLKIAQKYSFPIVATNNIFFKDPADFNATDVLSCIKQSVLQSDENRNKVINPQSYFKSPQEMVELFKDLPEAVENTINIAIKCNFFVEKQDLSLPKFSEDEQAQLKQNAKDGLNIRLKNEVFHRENNLPKEEIEKIYTDRLNFELDVIIRMNFCGYFLIVSDFIKWAKNNNIPVGPGRGSGAGSLVAWSLFITDVDPILFSLLFERFLNPQRISMPDFDIDFCQNGRDKVIEYVVNKYSNSRVAHIITFGTLQPRAAIKDVGRVMGLSYSEVDSISKKIPYTPPSVPINLTKIINEVEPLKLEISQKPHVKELFDIALKLEGLYRNISTHAAGVVISSQNLNEVAPLYYDNESSLATVGFSMKYIEDVGLVKFDFLALKTLTTIQKAVDHIQEQENTHVDILKISYIDDKISQMLEKGHTLGVFQIESRGMTEVIKQLKPDKIEDIIAIISLYRPGPMENIPIYINRKHKREIVEYLHPKMQPILDETFGIMIYQEQVMQIAQAIAGYSLGEADILRRAMGKKDANEMASQKSIFIKGAKDNNNIDENTASLIFDQMEKFAGYGFNKSHATAYALISWQTAYLKAYYPCEFLAASMSSEIASNNKEQQKFLEFVQEAKKYNIGILPASINHPCMEFSIEKKDDKKNIRYSLLALKGMGEGVINEIINEIEKAGHFTSLENFLQRINNKLLNKRSLESLIKSGAMDCVYDNRNELLENIDNLLNYNNSFFDNKNSNQFGLFDDSKVEIHQLNIKPTKPLTTQEALEYELEIVGCFLSGHPLEKYSDIIEKQQVKTYADVIQEKINNAYLACYLMKIKIVKSKSGTNYANLTFYDMSSVFNVILIGESYRKFFNTIAEGGLYFVKTQIKIEEDEVRLFIENMEEITETYKVKPINKKPKDTAIKLQVTISDIEHINIVKSIVIDGKVGKDYLLLKIYNNITKKYKYYEIKDIMIMESKLGEMKNCGLNIEINTITHN